MLEPFDFAVEKGFVNSFVDGSGSADAEKDPWNLWDDPYGGYGNGNNEF